MPHRVSVQLSYAVERSVATKAPSCSNASQQKHFQMLHVTVENLKLFACHGLYAEEQKLGNWFLLDIDLAYKMEATQSLKIEETVNYVHVISMATQRMCIKENLLENVLANLKADLLEKFSFLQAIKLKITKLQAPIASFTGQVSVSLNWKK